MTNKSIKKINGYPLIDEKARDKIKQLEDKIKNSESQTTPIIDDNYTLFVENKFDLTNTGTDSTKDTALLKEILNYAKEKNIRNIIFPKRDISFLIIPKNQTDLTDMNGIELPSNKYIDFNFNTIKIDPNFDKFTEYFGIYFAPDCENTILDNMIFDGCRDESLLTNKDKSGNAVSILLNGKGNKIINSIIKNTIGDGIIISHTEMPDRKFRGYKQAALFDDTQIDLFTNKESEYVLTTKFLNIADHVIKGYDMMIDGTYTKALEGESKNCFWCYTSSAAIFFYDKDKTLIKPYEFTLFEPIPEKIIPKNAVYFKLQFNSETKVTGYDSNLFILPLNFAENCSIENCLIDNCRRNGVTVGAVKNCKIVDSTICNTIGTAPQLGLDIEPEWGTCDGFIIERCLFFNNKAGAFTATKGRNVKVINNRVMENAALGYLANFLLKDNIVDGTINTSAHYAENQLNYPLSVIENNMFNITSRDVKSLFTASNTIIQNNVFKNIAQIRCLNNCYLRNNYIYTETANVRSTNIICKYLNGNQIIMPNISLGLECDYINDNIFNTDFIEFYSQYGYNNPKLINNHIKSNSSYNYIFRNSYGKDTESISFINNDIEITKTSNILFNISLKRNFIFRAEGNKASSVCSAISCTENNFTLTKNISNNININE